MRASLVGQGGGSNDHCVIQSLLCINSHLFFITIFAFRVRIEIAVAQIPSVEPIPIATSFV